MSLPLILIVVVCIMSLFAVAIFVIAKQNNFSAKQTIDPKPQQMYKSGQEDVK